MWEWTCKHLAASTLLKVILTSQECIPLALIEKAQVYQLFCAFGECAVLKTKFM